MRMHNFAHVHIQVENDYFINYPYQVFRHRNIIKPGLNEAVYMNPFIFKNMECDYLLENHHLSQDILRIFIP